MQTIDRPGRYVARWGDYEVILDNRAERCLVEVRRTDDRSVLATTGNVPRLTWREAIEWSAKQLGALGCSTFVDGQARSLSDFLAFERNDVEQHGDGS